VPATVLADSARGARVRFTSAASPPVRSRRGGSTGDDGSVTWYHSIGWAEVGGLRSVGGRRGGTLEGERGPRGRISGAGGRSSHRRQAGPVRKTVEVLLSGAVGMALVGILLALLHVGSSPPASAEESPSPGQHASATVPAALPGPASGQEAGIGGAGGNGMAGAAGGTQDRSGAAAAAHGSTAPASQTRAQGGASASATGSRSASPSAVPASSSPAPGLLGGAVGGAVGGVVGGVAGVVGQLVGGLSGGGSG